MTAHRPLEGLTVVVTASRRASELARLISNLGGSPYVVPTVGIELKGNEAETRSFLTSLIEGVDYAVFMTGPGVTAMMQVAERAGLKERLIASLNSAKVVVVARSGKPKAALTAFRIKVDAVPPTGESTAAGITRLLEGRVRGKTVCVMWHGSYSSELKDALTAAGADDVKESSVYRYSRGLESGGAGVLRSMGFNYLAPDDQKVTGLVDEMVSGRKKIDAITFTSPPAARNLFDVAEERGKAGEFASALRKTIVVAVGPSTRAAVEERGVKVDVMPAVSGMGAMVNALADFARQEG